MPITHSWQVIANLDGVPDVVITAPADWQGLVYNSATWKWENETIAGSWDMLRSIYDTNLRWVVDTSHDVSATPLITRSSVASQWGLVSCIDSSSGAAATTATTWVTNAVEDEKFNVFIMSTGTNVGTSSGQFVTGAGGTWVRVFRYGITWLTNVWATYCRASGSRQASGGTISLENLYKNAIPVKANTKYKLRNRFNVTSFTTVWTTPWFSCAVDTYTSAWVKVRTSAWYGAVYTASTWGFVQEVIEFTTWATETYIQWIFYCISGNGSIDIDLNAWTLDMIEEPVANSLTSSSPSLVSFTAVGSTNNIDQSQLSKPNGFVMNVAGQYVWQQFIPTKSKITWITLQRITSTGTPTWDMVFRIATDSGSDTPTATILATYTMPSATFNALSVWVDFTINLPCNVTAWTKYWILANTTVSSWVNYPWLYSDVTNVYTSGVCKYSADWITYWSTYAWDLYFKTLYYKPTTNFKASQNNSTVSISADEYWFLDWMVINRLTGAFSVPDVIHTSWSWWALAWNSYTWNDVRKFTALYSATSVSWTAWATTNIILPTSATKTDWYVVKFQWLNFTSITTSILVWAVWGTNIAWLAYSYDWITYTEFRQVSDDTEWWVTVTSTIDVTWHSTVYISLYRVSGADLRVLDYSFSGTVDTSSINTLRNYPTNKDIVNVFTKSLSSATTTAIYRATKFGFPAIEYTNGDYQFLNIDTTATSSVVSFSADGTSYTVVADWASIVLTSTVNPTVYVKTNITANRIYLSSNDYNAISDKDGSNKMTVVYDVTSQGLTYTVDELLSEVNELKAAVYALQNP